MCAFQRVYPCWTHEASVVFTNKRSQAKVSTVYLSYWQLSHIPEPSQDSLDGDFWSLCHLFPSGLGMSILLPGLVAVSPTVSLFPSGCRLPPCGSGPCGGGSASGPPSAVRLPLLSLRLLARCSYVGSLALLLLPQPLLARHYNSVDSQLPLTAS